jgi:hypothetical protein
MAGVAPLDVLFVADSRWWSFLCDRATCCPPEGSPVDAGASAIAALSAYSGLAVLPNRATLAAGLAPYGPEVADRMRAACDVALNRIAAQRCAPPTDPEFALALAPGETRPGDPEAALSEGSLVTGDGGLAAEPRVLDFDWGDVARAWQLADSLCDGQVPPDRALTDEAAGELLIALTDVRASRGGVRNRCLGRVGVGLGSVESTLP